MQLTSRVSEMSEDDEEFFSEWFTWQEDYILSGRSRDVLIEWLKVDPSRVAEAHLDDIIAFMTASRRKFLSQSLKDAVSRQAQDEMADWYDTGVDPFGNAESGWDVLTGQQKVGRIADFYKKSDQIVWNAISKSRK